MVICLRKKQFLYPNIHIMLHSTLCVNVPKRSIHTMCIWHMCEWWTVAGRKIRKFPMQLSYACLLACVCVWGGLPDVIGRWRLISVQLSNKFGYCLSWTVSLGRYEPSSPTKELYDMRQTLIVLIRHLEGALQLAGSFYVFNIFLTFNETLPATRPIS